MDKGNKHKKLVKIARVVSSEIYSQTDRHIDRHTHHNTSQPLPRANNYRRLSVERTLPPYCGIGGKRMPVLCCLCYLLIPLCCGRRTSVLRAE